ncbi:MAG: hypothetical protein REI09_01280 [Candidatus Dactylopiibacterium sp.]|nr:hypothetical protein [Candidatus Dactylopiibacterium sp.]
MTGKQWLRLALLAPFALAYLWLAHLASTTTHPSALSVLTGFVPLGASAALLAWHARSPWLIGLCLAAFGLIVTKLDFLCENAAWVYFVQHAGMHALLGIMFGRTLSGPQSAALCSQVAHFVHGDRLDATYYRYTWWVTLGWTAYFLLTTLASALLFAFAPVALWSVYANLATPLIIGALFAVEFALRMRFLPRHLRLGLVQTIRAYREYSQRRS